MPIQTVTREIDGIQFSITEFPVMRALPLKARLAAVLAPSLAQIMGLMGAGKGAPGKAMDLDVAALGPAITSLAAHLKPDEFAALCRDLFASTAAIIDGKRIDVGTDAGMNATFSAQIETMYKAIWAVLDVNHFFGLGGIGKAFGARMAKPTGESNPPAAS